MVLPALIVTALTLLATFGIVGIGGSVVTWSIVEILKMVAFGIVGLGFILIGMVLFWNKRKQLGRFGKGGLRANLPLLIPIILLIIGASFMDPGGFGTIMLPFIHIAFFIVGFLLIIKFILPVLENKFKKVSDAKLAIVSAAAMFFFVLGIPGVVFSTGGSTFALSTEGAAIANVEGPNMFAPLLELGGMIVSENPVLGFFIFTALIGGIGALVIKKMR